MLQNQRLITHGKQYMQLRLMRQWRLLRKLCSRAKSVTLVYQTGLSNFTYDEIKTCMGLWQVDVLQYGCNLFNQRMAKWIFPYAQEHEIGRSAIGFEDLVRDAGESPLDVVLLQHGSRAHPDLLPRLPDGLKGGQTPLTLALPFSGVRVTDVACVTSMGRFCHIRHTSS